MIRAALFSALLATATAETLEFELKAGQQQSVKLDSPVDDSHLREPLGYAGHGARTRVFTRSIEMQNLTSKPLKGRLLVVNRRDLTNAAGLRAVVGLGDGRAAIERLFTFWKDSRSHAGSGSPLAFEPFAALNFWGYTLCGEDTQAFARLAKLYDIDGRNVQLRGHVAGEYFYDGGWHVIDGDQNACYLRLDNRTLASAEDLRADPFLVLRTKVFGKHAPQSIVASAFNSSLIEHTLPPAEPKPIKLKTGPAPLNTFTLLAGESLIWHCATPPEIAAGQLNTEKPLVLRAAALATIEHRVAASLYPAENGVIRIHEPFPIVKAINHTTKTVFTPKPGEITFKAPVTLGGPGDKVSVFMQCSQFALPLLSAHENSVLLDAPDGKARVIVTYDPVPGAKLPEVKVAAAGKDGAFPITSKPAAERVWWQVAPARDFAFIAPSLEAVIPAAAALKFDPLTDTFLSPGRAYFLRVKAHAAGVWGDWSEPLEFRVDKPVQPGPVQFAAAGPGRVKLTWAGSADAYLVHASNRRDFVPELFAGEEIVAMEHLKPTENRPNKNLLTGTRLNEIEIEPRHRYYRIIARKVGAHSVPGPLAELPAEFTAGLPPAAILQVEIEKNASKEIYRVKEAKPAK